MFQLLSGLLERNECPRGARQRRNEDHEMTSMRDRFLNELRQTVDEWHAGDIDFATFIACRDATWHAIQQAGTGVEMAVLQAIRDQLPTGKPGVPTHLRLVIRVEAPAAAPTTADRERKDHCNG
jgi:hypothetical protein